MWGLHDRLEGSVSEDSCRAEIQSFLKHGQLVPVLGRPLARDPDYDVELVFGARRLFVARHLRKDLLVEIREMSDRDGIIAMDGENRLRADISPYERGMSYARWLRCGQFKSQDELARTLMVSPAKISRLLKLASLPSVIVAAFSSPLDICESWGLALSTILCDPSRKQHTIDAARGIRATKQLLPAKQVYRSLLSASVLGGRPKVSRHDEVVKDTLGHPLYRIRHLRNSIALLLPAERVSTTQLARIHEAILLVLQDDGVNDSGRNGSAILNDNAGRCPHG
jgi:ParB family chromosome partitioning protein